MFIGHFAPALAAATHKDAPSLPVLFIGAQLVDWAFFGLLLTGTEKMRVSPGISVMNPMDLYHMPYTHSLLGSAVFGALFAALIWLASRNRTAALIGFAGGLFSVGMLLTAMEFPERELTGLVLGAWGCGNFANDPGLIADLFRQALDGPFKGAFRRVTFAIVDTTPDQRCLNQFRLALSPKAPLRHN